jgi:hypothetical protein
MFRTATLVAALALSTAAHAQDQTFHGTCTALKTKDVCTATGWCQWTERKPIALPNGQTVQIPATCGFRSNFKKGWELSKQS